MVSVMDPEDLFDPDTVVGSKLGAKPSSKLEVAPVVETTSVHSSSYRRQRLC